jgi:hypothetical protein
VRRKENWPLGHLPTRQTYKGVFADTNKHKLYKKCKYLIDVYIYMWEHRHFFYFLVWDLHRASRKSLDFSRGKVGRSSRNVKSRSLTDTPKSRHVTHEMYSYYSRYRKLSLFVMLRNITGFVQTVFSLFQKSFSSYRKARLRLLSYWSTHTCTSRSPCCFNSKHCLLVDLYNKHSRNSLFP